MSKAQSYDAHQFAGRRSHPVEAHVTVDGWVGNGISYEDYSRMSTQSRKSSGERRLPTPIWAINNPLLRRVLVTFMEERAFSKKERARLKGGQKERLERAKAKIMSKRPDIMRVMDNLCAQFVDIKQKGLNPNITDKEWNEQARQPFMEFAEGEARYVDEQKRLRQLEIEIEGIDTYLRYTENGGADVVAAIVYLYYRTGLDSVGVASELGLKSPHIRQTLWRLHNTARRMEVAGELKPSQQAEVLAAKRTAKKTGAADKGKSYTPPLFDCKS